MSGARDKFEIESTLAGLNENAAPVKLTVWRVHEDNGSAEFAFVMAERVPDSWRTAQRLLQSCQLETVGRLASGVAHDFANLLTGILLYCDLLMLGLEPGTRLRKYAEEIRTAGMQATNLARELLSVARHRNASPRPLSLNAVAEGMRGLLGRLIGENVELCLQLDPDLGLVRMDQTQAQQVLLNLVLNARDALPEGGKITLTTSNCEMRVLGDASPAAGLPCVLFVVSDNGTGMDSETLQHLFEAFFTTKGPEKGTGLGLTTVHDIITGSGGLIHVDSALHAGTRVTVLLPQVDRAPRPASDAAGAPLLPVKELIS
jgi:signal transduction histidine kinase